MTFTKLKHCKLSAPFPCKEVFQLIAALIKALSYLVKIEVNFICGGLWKNWAHPSSTDIDVTGTGRD